MKAIDILRNHIRDLEKMVLVFDEYAMYKSRDESKKAIQELTQVIVELEDLQSRSCENCKFNSSKIQNNELITCDLHKEFINQRKIIFCGKWESK